MKALKSTLLHALELIICLAAAYVLLSVFQIEGESKTVIFGVVLSALTKFARASDAVPVKDYVNE